MRLAADIANTMAATWMIAMIATATAMIPRNTSVTLPAPSPCGTDGRRRRPSRAPRAPAGRDIRAFRRPSRAQTAAQPPHPRWRPLRTPEERHRLRYHCSPSEDAHFHVQVLFRIRLDLLQQIRQLRHRSIHVLIQLLVVEQLSRGPLTLIQRRGELVQTIGHRVEAVVQLLVGNQFARGPLALVDASR